MWVDNMVGFFLPKHLKVSQEISNTIKGILDAHFFGTKYDDGEHKITYPESIIGDEYILGFVEVLWTNIFLIEADYSNKYLENDVEFLGESLNVLFTTIYGKNNLEYIIERFHKLSLKKYNVESLDFDLGHDHGDIFYTILYNQKKKDDFEDDPKVIEAREYYEKGFVESFSNAFGNVTLGNHIKNKYKNVNSKEKTNIEVDNSEIIYKKLDKMNISSNTIRELEELKKLFDDGLISKEVWIAKQKKLMDL